MTDDAWVPYPLEESLTALRVERSADVARVTLRGPGKGNSMGPDFWHETPLVFEALDADDEIRAVVVTGAGGTFSYGLDLQAFAPTLGSAYTDDGGLAGARTALLRQIGRMQHSLNAVADCRKPVAAAVSGRCIGGGVDLISACDVRYGSAEASFSVREVRVAIVADLGSLQRLPGIIAEGHLRELALTGKDITAQRAAAIGLLNDVLPDPAGALAAAVGFAQAVAANPPLVVQGVKRVLDENRASRIADGLRYVAAWNSAFLPSHDLGEAMGAFAERRAPKFGGR